MRTVMNGRVKLSSIWKEQGSWIRSRTATNDSSLQEKLTNLARKALERAEELKGITPLEEKRSPVSTQPVLPSLPENTSASISVRASGPAKGRERPQLHRGSSAHLKVTGGQDTYTEEEKRVLLQTSYINSKEYVPFMSVDLTERFQYAIPFTDKDGLLVLSPKQKRDFSRWARPDEFCEDPKLVVGQHVDCFSIKQTVVSDCSFVASLAVSALYERRFGRQLITSIIYPCNRHKQPVYNPFGKYMVKLHINGVPRKVIIDDQLPVGKHGELLCSYSTNRNELWISLLEKAYMKVMGGYDFPGSNSNIDLHALTGWIPERVAIRPNDADFNKDSLFEKLLKRLDRGDVLITVATGELSSADEERTGLVPTHAYAVLDVRRVEGLHLLKLKNPWSHLRWRGNYSELDCTHWTPELRKLLNFDPNSAAMFDNGVFWIDYESILRFFDVFYLNWNPGLFKYTYCIHQSWKAGVGPIKDAYNIGENPQFTLEVEEGSGAVWILLTRHITQLEDFKENREYITVLVYRNDGRRVFYPNDPPPFIDGVRINSPHYLCKLIINDQSARRYTLVISQYEKMHTIFYTLRAYATFPFSLKKIGNPYTHVKEVSDGQWKGVTAGGCGNHPATYPNNPRYQITLESSHNNNAILLELRAPKQYQIGLDILCVVASDPNAPSAFKRKSSGPFRSGFVVLELEDVPAGTYDIIPSTFLPNQEGPFFLTVKSSCPVKLSKLR
ncbi:calpain-7 isoform X2 [Anabrus simplex]|uniref:calpain-7 isoform X2 n=1 Tax=Anabrus simplex TaxID=316456 RepID=UPI0035A2E0B2